MFRGSCKAALKVVDVHGLRASVGQVFPGVVGLTKCSDALMAQAHAHRLPG